jgi:hypothetical protein
MGLRISAHWGGAPFRVLSKAAKMQGKVPDTILEPVTYVSG